MAPDPDRSLADRVAVLAEAVGRCMAPVLRERFGLSRDEWRVLAALAAGPVRQARLMEATALEKMPVSRAVAGLERAGLLQRRPDPDDGRGWLLELRAAGRATYLKVVPLLQAREASLLDALTPAQRELLDEALEGLLERARTLAGR